MIARFLSGYPAIFVPTAMTPPKKVLFRETGLDRKFSLNWNPPTMRDS